MSETRYLPYGISDFTRVMAESYYYVDKTRYIPQIERKASFLFFTRPRRFGKTLWISMLSAYYDRARKEGFGELFGNLWIGSHKTALQGKYLMLTLDFSKVESDAESLKSSFDEYMRFRLDAFMDKYGELFPERIANRFYDSTSASAKLTILDQAAKDLQLPLYLIVDEYDNFTNTVLNEKGEEVYHAITHADGFYRDVFKKFKGMFERIILVGVSPVTLDDLTSGYNIGWNITMDSDFNQMLGFSEEEVREMLTYYKEAGETPEGFDIEKTIEEMKPWYDDYCFSQEAYENQSRVFNSDMVLYYMSDITVKKRPPLQMLDRNTGTDYKKLKKLLQLDSLDGDRKGVVHKIIEEGQIVSDVEDSFPASMLTEPRMFTSLLFYYGMLTIKGIDADRTVLGIPNNNVRKLYYEYLIEEYNKECGIETTELSDALTRMAVKGEWKAAIKYLANEYARVSSVRDGIEGERNIQGFFMAYLSSCKNYLLAPKLELSHGYCDFFLLPDLSRYTSTHHSYIIELKYLPKKDWADKAADQWKDAVAQIGRYAAAPRVEALRQGTELHKVVVQFCGWEVKRMEEV